MVESFERVEGRAAWYQPWGDPPDARSMSVAPDGTLYVNVHVGGVARSRDHAKTWTPTLDIETDVHQVLAHPVRPEIVLVAAAAGFGVSRDAGQSWQLVTAGLHAHYLRAVAVAGDDVVISASANPKRWFSSCANCVTISSKNFVRRLSITTATKFRTIFEIPARFTIASSTARFCSAGIDGASHTSRNALLSRNNAAICSTSSNVFVGSRRLSITTSANARA